MKRHFKSKIFCFYKLLMRYYTIICSCQALVIPHILMKIITFLTKNFAQFDSQDCIRRELKRRLSIITVMIINGTMYKIIIISKKTITN